MKYNKGAVKKLSRDPCLPEHMAHMNGLLRAIQVNYFNLCFHCSKYPICFCVCVLLFSGSDSALPSIECVMDFQLASGPMIVLCRHETLSNLQLPAHLIYLLFISAPNH